MLTATRIMLILVTLALIGVQGARTHASVPNLPAQVEEVDRYFFEEQERDDHYRELPWTIELTNYYCSLDVEERRIIWILHMTPRHAAKLSKFSVEEQERFWQWLSEQLYCEF